MTPIERDPQTGLVERELLTRDEDEALFGEDSGWYAITNAIRAQEALTTDESLYTLEDAILLDLHERRAHATLAEVARQRRYLGLDSVGVEKAAA